MLAAHNNNALVDVMPCVQVALRLAQSLSCMGSSGAARHSYATRCVSPARCADHSIESLACIWHKAQYLAPSSTVAFEAHSMQLQLQPKCIKRGNPHVGGGPSLKHPATIN